LQSSYRSTRQQPIRSASEHPSTNICTMMRFLVWSGAAGAAAAANVVSRAFTHGVRMSNVTEGVTEQAVLASALVRTIVAASSQQATNSSQQATNPAGKATKLGGQVLPALIKDEQATLIDWSSSLGHLKDALRGARELVKKKERADASQEKATAAVDDALDALIKAKSKRVDAAKSDFKSDPMSVQHEAAKHDLDSAQALVTASEQQLAQATESNRAADEVADNAAAKLHAVMEEESDYQEVANDARKKANMLKAEIQNEIDSQRKQDKHLDADVKKVLRAQEELDAAVQKATSV